MGCGSMSTMIVHPHQRTPSLKEKDKPISSPYSEKLNGLSQTADLGNSRQFHLTPESNVSMRRNERAPGDDAKKISNFKMTTKEIDDGEHAHDDGGVWLGGYETFQTESPNVELTEIAAQNSSNDKVSSSQLEETEPDISPDNTHVPVYAAIDNSNSPDSVGHCTTACDNTANEETPASLIMRRSIKQKQFQNDRALFESVEDKFSYGFEPFDDDKQMSDTELDDHVTNVSSDTVSGSVLKFSNSNIGNVRQSGDMDKDITDSSRVSKPSSNMTYVLPADSTKENVEDSYAEMRQCDPLSKKSSLALDQHPGYIHSPLIPHFVYKCVNYIEEHGIKTEGLYRISGNKAQADLFLDKFSQDPDVNIASLQISVHTVATLLKSFFKDLNEPLIPQYVYDKLTKAAETGDNKLVEMKEVVKELPPRNYEILKFIVIHLFNVAEHQEFNSMSSQNLAKCWWPTLIRLDFESYDALVQGSLVPEDIVQTLIDHCRFIFS